MDPFNPSNTQRENAQELVRKEMERISRDTIMVYNPTDDDYRVEWDGFYHVVPNKNKNVGFGKGKRELERFLARKYVTHMKDQIINRMAMQKGQEMLEKRTAQGKEPLLDKYFENREIWDKVPRTDDPKLTEKIFGDLWLGVVRPYGADEADEASFGDGRVDTRTMEERILANMNRPYTDTPEEEIQVVAETKAKAMKDL